MSDGDQRSEQSTSLSLLERARRRDPQAWDRLLHLYRPLVLFWCRRARLHGPDVKKSARRCLPRSLTGWNGSTATSP